MASVGETPRKNCPAKPFPRYVPTKLLAKSYDCFKPQSFGFICYIVMFIGSPGYQLCFFFYAGEDVSMFKLNLIQEPINVNISVIEMHVFRYKFSLN